jgi:hypothetical protein
MDRIQFNLHLRGRFLIIVSAFVVAFGIASQADRGPKEIRKKILNKTHIIKMNYLPIAAKSVAGLSLLYAFYVALLAKTTNIDASRLNLTRSHGIFLRRRDSLDMTGIQDFTKQETLIDLVLGVSRFIIYSKDKTDPKLVLLGIKRADANALYEHLKVFTNHSIVQYVQGEPERRDYHQKFHDKQQPEPTETYRRPNWRTQDEDPEGDT